MKTNHVDEGIDITRSDLIMAVSDAAFELCEDKRETYILAGLALEEILKRAHLGTSENEHRSVDRLKEGIRFN